MAFEPEPMEDEDTDVVVRRHRAAHRRMAVTILLPVFCVVALVVTWVVLFSGPGCEQRFWKGFELPGNERTATKSWVVDPSSPTARLHVIVSEPAKVWLDDEPIGTIEEARVELSPGTHDVRTRTRRGGEMSTMLTAKAGEVFKVFFNRETKKIHLYRVGADGEATELP